MRINEIKRVYKHDKCYIITEYLINGQNNFFVENKTDGNDCGVSMNTRGALRMIERDSGMRTLDMIKSIVLDLKDDKSTDL